MFEHEPIVAQPHEPLEKVRCQEIEEPDGHPTRRRVGVSPGRDAQRDRFILDDGTPIELLEFDPNFRPAGGRERCQIFCGESAVTTLAS
jgi:hypothetical protein